MFHHLLKPLIKPLRRNNPMHSMSDDSVLTRCGKVRSLVGISVDVGWSFRSISTMHFKSTYSIITETKRINRPLFVVELEEKLIKAFSLSLLLQLFFLQTSLPKMSNNQQVLRSEVVLEKYGKALAGKTGNERLPSSVKKEALTKPPSFCSAHHWRFRRLHCRRTRTSAFRRRSKATHHECPCRIKGGWNQRKDQVFEAECGDSLPQHGPE